MGIEYSYEMKSVAIVTNSIKGGGAEKSMNLLAEYLSKKEYPIDLIAINESPREFVKYHFPVTEIGRQWKGSIFNSIRAMKLFFTEIRRINPEIVILNCDLPEFFSFLIPLRCKLFCVEHTTNPWRGRRLLGRIMREYLFRRSATWIRVSDHITSWPKKIRYHLTIPNPVEIPVNFTHLERSASIKRLVFIGRLSSEKNPALVIEIAAQIGFPVLLIGDGPMKVELLDTALKIKAEAEFLGFTDDPWACINESDLLIVSSNYEGDGLVLLESIARKVPVLVHNVPDLARFFLPDRNYFSSLADAVSKIRAGQSSRQNFIISEEQRMQILSDRNIEAIAKSWIDALSI
jgi:glycosyltransferase involved in cell wall biosynthesis